MPDLFFRVTVSAADVSYDLSPDLTSLLLDEERSRPDMLTVRVSDPYHVFSHAFQEGMEIEAELGTADDHSFVFRGRIYSVDGSFPNGGVPTMTIRGYDNSMKMGLRPRNRPWQGTTSQPIDLESIVRQIAREHGFSSLNVELRGNPTFPHNGIRQQDETDLAFLQRLARTFGCELFVEPNEDDDTLNFVSQYSIMNSDPEVTLYYARCDVDHHLRRFDPRSSVSDIQLPRAYSGIDYDSGEPTEVTRADIAPVHTSEDDFLDENMLSFSQQSPERAPQVEALIAAAPVVQTQLRTEMGGVQRVAVPAFVTQETLSHLALNQFSTSLNGMRASGETPGNHRLHAQNNVGIANVGGRFSNTWYLSRVTHTLDGRGYSTTFECER